MKTVDENLKYIREKITNAKGFHLLEQNSDGKYRFKVEGERPFEYAPSVVFLFSEEFVARADSKKLAKSVKKAILRALEVLKDPPSKKCYLQGWIKVDTKGVIFVPYIIPQS